MSISVTEVSCVMASRAERSGAARTAVNCQVVGNAVKKSFTLVLVMQDKGELWRAAVDSHILLEVILFPIPFIFVFPV